MIKNTNNRYGLPAIIFHWLSALTIIGLFCLGWWMVDLDYYSDWYRSAPHIHKSVGVLLFLVTVCRLVWRRVNVSPTTVGTQLEVTAAKLVHTGIYILIFVVLVSGYFISTAKGDAIQVFNWFSVPALLDNLNTNADLAGVIHYWAACSVLGLALLHAGAALKHHFFNKDDTLKKMLTLK